MKEEGIKSILVNSNPATIMTDNGVADVTYIEPLTVPVLERIIKKERPDALLPTLGGQTGLNLARDLANAQILKKYDVELLGSSLETVELAEDRDKFRNLLEQIGEPTPHSNIVESWEDAIQAREEIGLPLVIRPAYTLGGTGGGIAFTEEEYEQIIKAGLRASPIGQVLVEQSLLGWKELEYEVMRDGNDTCITICNMENLDPMGVHTGDSIVVAPSQTLSDREYHMLRNSALKIIRALDIEGGCNVQFALAPRPNIVSWDKSEQDDDPPYFVIEVNPRVSRSSALASKATGYPIARVAAKIAIGKNLHEISNSVTQKTTAAFEPALDYCVVKIPRWPFDKFQLGNRNLGTQMKATGEVMAIDRTFEGAIQKAIRSLEISDRSILWENSQWTDTIPFDATDERLWALLAALRRNWSVEKICKSSQVDPWFIERFARIVEMERRLLSEELTPQLLFESKRLGFGDRQIATLADHLPEQVRSLRDTWDIRPVYKMVDTCAGEFDALTPYYYSTYEQENEAIPEPIEKMLVIGSGPIRIGQGIEFDYCSVKAAQALRSAGIQAILANSNPETVSTDFDTSDRLYFEPLDEESIRDLLENEGGLYGDVPSSVVQFGGQTAVNLAQSLADSALPIAGSSADSIDLAENRSRFEAILSELEIPQPPGVAVDNLEEALTTADAIGYPVLVRPSYVLGGRAMEIVQNANELVHFFTAAIAEKTGSVLIDKYLSGREFEVDAVCDGQSVLIPGIMEHIERAGVHSGDSIAVYPPQNLSEKHRQKIVEYTMRMGKGLNVRGLMNVQFVIPAGNKETEVFVIEVNPRSSRTIPFISKITGVPMVELAVKVSLGESLADQGYPNGLWPERNLVAVKAPVFSMSKLTDVDTHLGPEMKSTGEVMGIDRTFSSAVTKALISSDLVIQPGDKFLLSLSNQTKTEAIPLIRKIHDAGCEIYATEGTSALIEGLNIPVKPVTKLLAGHPNVVDIIRNGTVQVVINTIEGGREEIIRDGFHIRRAATEQRIPCFTSLDTAETAIGMLSETISYNVAPLIEYRDG
tara:strand:+ start:4627 stop:7767 length:3141 start_codon:yes stop_codon:yes gene_type:complete